MRVSIIYSNRYIKIEIGRVCVFFRSWGDIFIIWREYEINIEKRGSERDKDGRAYGFYIFLCLCNAMFSSPSNTL